MTENSLAPALRVSARRFAAVSIACCLVFAGQSGGVATADAGASHVQGYGAWWAGDGVFLSQTGGRVCASIAAGTREPWDALIGLNGIALERDGDYRLAVRTTGRADGPLRARVQENAPPWTAYGAIDGPFGAEGVSTTFRAPAGRHDAQIVFQLGGAEAARRICFDAVSLERVYPSADEASSPVRVNQAGYLVEGPKRATFTAGGDTAKQWRLKDAEGTVAASGMTRPFGFDPASGMKVQTIDFSTMRERGDGFTLSAGDAQSPVFSIGGPLYDRLRVDALSFYYPMRSGIAVDGAIAGEAYARPAGHLGKPPNKGDAAVPCLDGNAAAALYGTRWTCSYRLDVTGGWYDAGDQGKYVVDGGIAVAQVMATYERALHFAPGSAALKDGVLRIPEAANGVPDVLDEARWELDFMMTMTVPDGEPLAGMVHHSVHDVRWTVPPMLPGDDPMQRVVYRPSTAATLNLAAAAAQGARLFRPFDAAYSDTLLSASRSAFEAARATPDLFQPPTDGLDGGGAYEDDDVADEFFWAAAELFITTGEKRYLSVVKASEYWNTDAFDYRQMNWRNVAGLGKLDLALLPSVLDTTDRLVMRRSVVESAERILAAQSLEGFGVMYTPHNGKYAWGSNAFVLENMVIAAAAFDLTERGVFLQGVRESIDYIFGRNALGISYVTGYGTRFAENQHSRWFAHSVDPSLPRPPDGSLAGGSNSWLSDAVSKERLEGCAPQACYVDDIEAFSTNEITVSWNAALSFIASFLADTR